MCVGYIQTKDTKCNHKHKCGVCIGEMLTCFSGKILSNYPSVRIYPLIWANCKIDNFYVVIFYFIDKKIKEKNESEISQEE